MALLYEEDLMPFFGNPNIQRQGAKARALAAQRDVNTLPDPRTYAAISGLLGQAPDEMGFSVLNPDYQGIQNVARPAYGLGLAAQLAPFLAPITKGLPVGASIKNINLGEGIFKPEITMQEMLRVRDIPTVERVQRSMDLVGEKKFQEMVESQFKQYKPTNQTQEAMLVESVTLDILGKANRDPKLLRGLPGLKIPAPQQAALDLAQQRAALPVEQGGLGLPAGNTPAQRAKAQGGKDMVHFSRAGGDYTTLDSGKFAIAPFDAVGTHVGTPQAAMERFQNTVGYKVNNPNYANDELRGTTYPVTILGNKPLMNQNGMPFGEDDLNAFLRQQGGHNYSDIQGGKMTYQDMNADLRKKLFEEQGYTSIPYYNEVEGKGSISYIVPPENIRSRFAAHDPFRRSAAIAATMGVAAPDLLAAQQDEEMRKLQQLGLLGMVAP